MLLTFFFYYAQTNLIYYSIAFLSFGLGDPVNLSMGTGISFAAFGAGTLSLYLKYPELFDWSDAYHVYNIGNTIGWMDYVWGKCNSRIWNIVTVKKSILFCISTMNIMLYLYGSHICLKSVAVMIQPVLERIASKEYCA